VLFELLPVVIDCPRRLPGLIIFASLSRVRGVRGAIGAAAERDSGECATCTVRDLLQPPGRRSVAQRAAAVRRPQSVRCWWRCWV